MADLERTSGLQKHLTIIHIATCCIEMHKITVQSGTKNRHQSSWETAYDAADFRSDSWRNCVSPTMRSLLVLENLIADFLKPHHTRLTLRKKARQCDLVSQVCGALERLGTAIEPISNPGPPPHPMIKDPSAENVK
jgi:hypothetical protein